MKLPVYHYRNLKRFSILALFGFLSSVSFAQTLSNYIVTDQFGYRTADQKIAVLRDPQIGADAAESYTPGVSYALVNELSKVQVFTGSAVAWNAGGTDPHSGDKVWHFDFSSITTPGTYYVLDITNNVKSYSFDINDDVYNNVLKHAVRTFFYQRANFAKATPYADSRWTDGASHVGPGQQKNCRYYLDQTNATLERDLTGGWFDAGDMYKYTPWTAGYIVTMLNAYRDNPTVWTDDYNLPESGNNIPDLLDEAKWGMNYLRRLQNDDGSLIALVNGPGGSPPSSATGKCLYGKVSTAAALKAASAFALGSTVYRMIGLTCYADTLQIAAEKAWGWAKNNPLIDWNNSSDAAWTTAVGWSGGPLSCNANCAEDEMKMKLEAATFLFELTKTTEYQTYFDANYLNSDLIKSYYLNPFQQALQEALLHYTSISGASPAVVTDIKSKTLAALTSKVAWGGSLMDAYDTKIDAYNSYMKDYTWGSNSVKCSQGLIFYEMTKYGISPTRSADAMVAAENFIHYIHGLNALSKNYLSNMNDYGADNSVTELFHSWFTDGSALWDKVGVSTYGPAPGFLVGGPNTNYSGANVCCKTAVCGSPANNAKCTAIDITKIMGQPKHKSYTDFNTDWQLQSWEMSENSCGYQSVYIRLLSNFVKKLGTTPTLQDCVVTETENALKTYPVDIFPNPSAKSFNIVCNANFKAEVFCIEGKLMETVEANGRIEVGENLEPGMYIIKVNQQNKAHFFKIIKL
jgi:endoglucanase